MDGFSLAPLWAPEYEFMFCQKCGNSLQNGSRFCDSCGAAVGPAGPAPATPQYQQTPQYPQPVAPYQQMPSQPMYAPVPMKSTGIAALLALIIPGLGYIYVGKIMEGIIILILAIVLGVLFWLLIPIVILLVLWVWQIYAAYQLANQYNAAVQQTGRAPW
jgi:TM2 domain-containing membrane protein YozV